MNPTDFELESYTGREFVRAHIDEFAELVIVDDQAQVEKFLRKLRSLWDSEVSSEDE